MTSSQLRQTIRRTKLTKRAVILLGQNGPVNSGVSAVKADVIDYGLPDRGIRPKHDAILGMESDLDVLADGQSQFPGGAICVWRKLEGVDPTVVRFRYTVNRKANILTWCLC